MITAHLAAVHAPPDAPNPEIDEELEAVSRDLEAHLLAPSTRRAYGKAWWGFTAFRTPRGLTALPTHPEIVRWYVAWMSTQTNANGLPRFALATIRQHLAGIADRHLGEGFLDPTGHRSVTALVSGLFRIRATRPVRKRPPVLDDVLRTVREMGHEKYPASVSAARQKRRNSGVISPMGCPKRGASGPPRSCSFFAPCPAPDATMPTRVSAHS